MLWNKEAGPWGGRVKMIAWLSVWNLNINIWDANAYVLTKLLGMATGCLERASSKNEEENATL